MYNFLKIKFLYFSFSTCFVLILLSGCADTLSKYTEPLKNIKITSDDPIDGKESKTEDKIDYSENKNFAYLYDDLPTNYSPESDPDAIVDELGLWMQVKKMEKQVATSGGLIKDKSLNDYIKKVFCNVSPEYCNEIRIYVVRAPYFNASMYPNGMMHIWTGALLRFQNEAQLAAVMGHELAHYLRRHSYTAQERAVKASGAATWAQLILGAAGLSSIQSVLNMALKSNFYSYGRNDEREADGYGLVLLSRAGYDPEAASNIWQRLIQTNKNASIFSSPIFYSTHPSSKERENELRRLSRVVDFKNTRGKGKDEYIAAIKPMIPLLIADEIKHGEFKSSMALFDKLIEDEFYVAYSYFARAELYRISEEEKDIVKAMENYKISEKYDQFAVKDLYKSIGLTQISMNKKQEAKKSFAKYLELNPDASDSKFIKTYMEEL